MLALCCLSVFHGVCILGKLIFKGWKQMQLPVCAKQLAFLKTSLSQRNEQHEHIACAKFQSTLPRCPLPGVNAQVSTVLGAHCPVSILHVSTAPVSTALAVHSTDVHCPCVWCPRYPECTVLAVHCQVSTVQVSTPQVTTAPVSTTRCPLPLP